MMSNYNFLSQINFPSDLKKISESDLEKVADELREETISAVSETGGHLGASLGVVELTVALHYVFNTPKDKLIWDVGHQCYPHKIITGRKNQIRTLRQGGGISGFTKRSESEYDPFGAAHSSTSISSALGIAEANKLSNKKDNVVAIIGDGAISGGMAYEAMNNAGVSKTKMVVILNDNDMSIARPAGAMGTYLAKIFSGKIYFSLRETIKMIISSFSKRFSAKAGKAEDLFRSAISGGTLFNALGFYYIGPIDGHDMDSLIPILKNVRDSKYQGPILIHIKTKKGKGYSYAEKAKDHYHGVSKFNVKTGEQYKTKSKLPSYTKVFSNTLIQHAKKDSKIVAITAAMPDGTGLTDFAKEFPDRTFDVGIAEQHAVTFAAGMACEGYKPFCAIYSTFLQRAFDQIVHDVAIQSLPVRFMIDRAGLVGADGATHAGSFDIGYLGILPNFILMAAAHEKDLIDMVATAHSINHCPSAVRYPRGNATGKFDLSKAGEILSIGKGEIVQQGQKIAILSYGARLSEAQKAAEYMKQNHNIEITIANAKFAKPLDNVLIENLVKNHDSVITIEEGARGGFSTFVLEHLAEHDLLGAAKIKTMTLPDIFQDQDTSDNMYIEANLDVHAIIKQCELFLG